MISQYDQKRTDKKNLEKLRKNERFADTSVAIQGIPAMILKKLKKFLDTQGRKKRKRAERRDASDFLPSNATDLGLVAKILVANFEGLDGITASRAVAAAFAEESEVMASPLNYALKQPTKTSSVDRTNLQTEMTQRVLDEQKGALLVWGASRGPARQFRSLVRQGRRGTT